MQECVHRLASVMQDYTQSGFVVGVVEYCVVKLQLMGDACGFVF